MMWKKFICILILLILIITFLSSNIITHEVGFIDVATTGDNVYENIKMNTQKVEIKGFVLKYVLIDATSEMYEINVTKPPHRLEKYYQDKEYYNWLISCYRKFNEDMKQYLEEIYKAGSVGYYMNILTRVPDDSSIDDIINELLPACRNDSVRIAIKSFFPYFYTNFFKEYLYVKNEEFNIIISNIRKQVEENNPDIIGFMENISGISFKARYKPELYYIFDNVSAYGFNNGNIKISTIQETRNDYKSLFGAPFHEYSHELFKTFTKSQEFISVANQLKKDSNFYEFWRKSFRANYDWIGWCEENLVEGFSQYLVYKYYGSIDNYCNYVYDRKFFEYLLSINFDGHRDSLKNTSIEFLKTLLSLLLRKMEK